MFKQLLNPVNIFWRIRYWSFRRWYNGLSFGWRVAIERAGNDPESRRLRGEFGQGLMLREE